MKRWDRRTFIFQIAVGIYLATTMLDLSMLGHMTLFAMVTKGLRYFAYLLLILKLIEDAHYEVNQLIKYGLGIFISFVSYYITKEKTLIFLMLFLMAIRNIYFCDVLKTALWTNGICLISILIICKVGLIPERFATGIRNRRSLGFVFASIGSNYWLYFVLIYIAYRKEKMKIVEGVILQSITWYFYHVTDTKNAFAVSTIALLMAYILKLWKSERGKYLFSFFIKYVTLIGTISFGLLVFMWEKVEFITVTINDWVTGRIGLTYRAIQTYGIRLFGQPIEWVGGMIDHDTTGRAYNYVDSSYMQIMLTYGIVVLFILIVAYSVLGKEIVKAEKWYMGTAIMLGALHSTFDPQFLLMQYNIFLLALGYLMISDKSERRKYLFGLSKEEG